MSCNADTEGCDMATAFDSYISDLQRDLTRERARADRAERALFELIGAAEARGLSDAAELARRRVQGRVEFDEVWDRR